MQFARSGERLSGEFRPQEFPAKLPRLADILTPESSVVQYQLSGGAVSSGSAVSGRPSLRLEVRATVWLVCQRCLGLYPEMLALDRVFPIARNEAELSRWERDEPLLDALLADPKMAVAELVEDEILLSLPTVPHHPDGECGQSIQAVVQ